MYKLACIYIYRIFFFLLYPPRIAFANCGHKLCKRCLIWNKLVVVVVVVCLLVRCRNLGIVCAKFWSLFFSLRDVLFLWRYGGLSFFFFSKETHRLQGCTNNKIDFIAESKRNRQEFQDTGFHCTRLGKAADELEYRVKSRVSLKLMRCRNLGKLRLGADRFRDLFFLQLYGVLTSNFHYAYCLPTNVQSARVATRHVLWQAKVLFIGFVIL